MKGHMEKDGFHPHTQYKGVRKSRDQSAKTEGVVIRKARQVSKIKFSNKEEETKLSDLGKYQVPSDKIHVTNKSMGLDDEAFEAFTFFKNKDDAKLFIKTFNDLEENILGLKSPMVIRRFVQNGVGYDVYKARWRVIRNGELVEADIGDPQTHHFKDNPDFYVIPLDQWSEFKKAVKEIIPTKVFA